jgi:hypothetical protein
MTFPIRLTTKLLFATIADRKSRTTKLTQFITAEQSARIAALKAINPAADANTTIRNLSGELIARSAAVPSAKEAKDDLEVN